MVAVAAMVHRSPGRWSRYGRTRTDDRSPARQAARASSSPASNIASAARLTLQRPTTLRPIPYRRHHPMMVAGWRAPWHASVVLIHSSERSWGGKFVDELI